MSWHEGHYARKTKEVGEVEAPAAEAAVVEAAADAAALADVDVAAAVEPVAAAEEVPADAVVLPAGGAAGGAAAAGGAPPPPAPLAGAGENAAWSRAIFPAAPPTGAPPSVLFVVAWDSLT